MPFRGIIITTAKESLLSCHGKNSRLYREEAQASGEVTTLDSEITHVKLLITIDSESVATLTKKSNKRGLLIEQVQ